MNRERIALGPERSGLLAAFAMTAAALSIDLLVSGVDGLTLPLYAGAVLFVATRAGGGAAVVAAVACIVALLAAHGSRLDDAALIGGAALLLGAALFGRVLDQHRRRIARLEHVIGVLRRETRPAAVDTAPNPMPSPPPSTERPATGNLPRLLYRYARLLNVADEDAIYTGLALTLEEVLPARRVAVYALTPSGPRLAAGDPLPAPPTAVAAEGASPIFTADDDPDTAYARVRQGAEGPVTAVLVIHQPGVIERPGALKLLATFVQWASASVGHTRALAQLDDDQRAERGRLARVQGRAAARAFAETGSLPILPPESAPSARARSRRPERVSVFGQNAPPPPSRAEISDDDDTERIAPQAIVGAFAEELAERRPRHSDGLPFGPARPSMPTGPGPAQATRDERAAPTAGSSPGVVVSTSAIIQPPPEHIDGEVRAAIERMARRLVSGPPSWPTSGDEPGVPSAADFEGINHERIDDDMMAAEDLPLIGGPGLGVATELGRSPVKDRFAHLLADLSDHLDGEGDTGQ